MLVGFIKLHRKFKDWQWYKDVPTKTLFIELLLRCQYATGEDDGIQLEEGQLLASRKDLAEDCGLSESQVRTALAHLRDSQEITSKLANNSTKKKTLITIVNWRKYQAFLNENRQENRQENSQENRQPLKNIKNINNISSSVACAREQISSDDIIAMEELRNLPLEAQLRFEDIADELIKKYFSRECNVSDKAAMYWWLELLSSKPQMTDSDLELLSTAFKIAYESDSMNFKYIGGIFNNWADNEIRTISDYHVHEIRRRK